MALVHFNSWSDVDTLQRHLNRILDDVVTPISWKDSDTVRTVPPIEMYESDDAIFLHIELPGINPNDLDVEVTEDSVSVRGDRQSVLKSDASQLHTEFRYGTLTRVISLPSRVKNTAVKAEFNNGILHLTLPKTDAEKNRVVKVNITSA